MKYIMIIFIVVFFVSAALVYKWAHEIDKVLVPVHLSLDTAKYKILKEDSLTIEGMKIKRIYYLQRKP